MPDGRLLHLRDTYPTETAWAPPWVGDELRQVRTAAWNAHLADIRARAEAKAAGDRGQHDSTGRHQELGDSYQALHDTYRQRETVFAAAMANRADWDAATRAQRHLAVAADAELRRRHPGQHHPPLRSAEPQPVTQAQRDELTLTAEEPIQEAGQWIKDLAAAHHVFADTLAERQSLTIPSENPVYGDLGQAFLPWPRAGQGRHLAVTQARDPAVPASSPARRGPRRRPGGRRLTVAVHPGTREVTAMTAIAITGMGLTGVLRITWVQDNLADGEIADLTWEAPDDLAADHSQVFLAAMHAHHAGDTERAGQLWENLQAIWSQAWSANYAALEFMQGTGLTRFSPVKPQHWVVASFEHHTSPHGLPRLHIHNIAIPRLITGANVH